MCFTFVPLVQRIERTKRVDYATIRWYNRSMTKQINGQKNHTSWAVVIARLAAAAAVIYLGISWPKLLSGQRVWIEQTYSEGIYQTIRKAISAVTSLVPFSIAEFLLYGLVIGALALLVTRLFQLIRRRIPVRVLLGSVASLLLIGGIILNLFYATWGFNYFREPLADRMELTLTSRPVEELEAFVRKTAGEASKLRETLHEDNNGVFAPEESTTALFQKIPQGFAALSEQFPMIEPDPTRAKQIFWARGLSWQGISGIYIGLTAEPNVNADQPPLLRYQAAAHEMAHQTGIASENEAEFVGYLACLNSNDPNVRYSGLVYALIVSGNALFDADSERYLAVTDTYSDAIWRDFEDYNRYWDSFEGEVRESADRRNDAYLKHNSQPSGILSYGEAVDLLLAYSEKYGN